MCLVDVFVEQYQKIEIFFRHFVQMTQPLGFVELFRVGDNLSALEEAKVIGF